MAAIDDSTGFVEQEETSSLDSVAWTDEKHSMYLKSMEASFVHQLYNSCRQGEPAGLGQPKAHQHGKWQKTFYRTSPYTHFRAMDNNAFEQQPLGFGGQMLSSRGSENITRMLVDGEHHQVSLNLNEEVSDQNFVNEDYENRAASGQRAKRVRTLDASAASSNDQVVPFGVSQLVRQDHDEGCSDSQDRMMESSEQAAKTESAF